MIFYQNGLEQYPQRYFMDVKNPVLKFKPPNSGEWLVSGGIFLFRDNKVVWSYDKKDFIFNVVDKESTAMN